MQTAQLYALFLKSSGVTTDTRKLSSNTLFFALSGARFNGNAFAQEALDAGCRAAIIDDQEYATGDARLILVPDVLKALQELATHHRLQMPAKVIGLTGSNGKTTSKELLRDVLAQKFKTYATKGNLNNHIGVPLSLLEIQHHHEMAVIEMGANAQGEIAQLSAIAQPDFGFITNIGKAHLEGFGGIEGVKKGKGELFRFLRSNDRMVFVNAADPVLLELSEGLRRVLYGTDVYSPEVYIVENSPLLTIGWSHQSYFNTAVHTKLTGDYNIGNIAAAIAIGRYFGIDHELINSALENYTPDNNRSERRKTVNNQLILDAYNANPSSMTHALKSFATSSDDAKLCILGDMYELGSAAPAEHAAIVALVHALKLKAIFVGSLFQAQVQPNDLSFETTTALREHLIKERLQGQTILLKGSRGMKLEQVIDLL
jgi:UDP-N-acetylmuramoyl-tripeptide--D-alanyl-D-alanine ligase